MLSMREYDDIYKLIERIAKQGESAFASYDPSKDLIYQGTNTSIYDSINEDVNKKMLKSFLTYRADKQEHNPLESAVKLLFTGDKFKFDYDVCLTYIILYGIICPYVGEGRQIVKYDSNKYNWVDESGKNYAIRGDTMNSFNTPVKEYIRLYGDNPSEPTLLVVNPGPRNKGKFRVPYKPYDGWYDLILDNLDYFAEKLPVEAMKYIENYHRIGNMIPIPFIKRFEEFNVPRGRGKTKDFWDLCMYEIYLWFESKGKNDIYLQNIVTSKGNVNLLKEWLGHFGSWKQFIEENYLQDFCDENLYPIEYWSGHFEVFEHSEEAMPKSVNEFFQFFRNASQCMEKRSMRISKKLNEIFTKDK